MSSEGKYLMVVEAGFDLAPFLEALLQDEGYEVQCCVRYDRALEEARRRRPDLIIMEMQRPGLNHGQKALERLANDPTTASIPVIALATIPAVLSQLQRYPNVMAGIMEPFDLDDLLSHIRRLSGADPDSPT
jgi:CheY-like chemotaxis protein